MASTINASTTLGLISTADTSGVLQLQTANTTAVTVDASQNVTFVGSQTLSAGTANGVTYLNGSKVLTSGSALVFDGASFKNIGPTNALIGAYSANNSSSQFVLGNSAGTAHWSFYETIGASGQQGTFNLYDNVAASLRLTVDTSGNIGIGTSSPLQKLHCLADTSSALFQGGTLGGITFLKTGQTGMQLFSDATGTLKIYDNNAGAAVLTMSNQNLGLGVTPSVYWGGNKGLDVGSPGCGLTSRQNNEINLCQNAAFNVYATTGAAAIFGIGNNGQFAWNQAASGTAGSTISFTTRMLLDTSGNLLLGSTNAAGRFYSFTSSNQWALYGEASSSALNSGLLALVAARNTTNNTFKAITYYNSGAGADRFYVTDGGAVYGTGAYNQISDGRLKENVKDLDIGLSSVLNLQPRFFDWKSGKGSDTKNNVGFIAQEVEVVLPHSVTEWTNSQGDPTVYKAVSMESMIPVLVKAIQEQQALIVSLKARLDAANL